MSEHSGETMSHDQIPTSPAFAAGSLAVDGGTMYHDQGMAGLPQGVAKVHLLRQHRNGNPGGNVEISNGVDDPVVERPLCVTGSLFP